MLTAGDALALITNLLGRTRPAESAELYQALNYGYAKAVRALSAIRPEHFSAYVDPFTVSPGVTEYDISGYVPELFRPTRLIVGGGGVGPVYLFRYKAMSSLDSEDAEGASGLPPTLCYDILTGLLPGPSTTFSGAPGAGATQLVLDAPLDEAVPGAAITMAGAGMPKPLGTATVRTPYYGVVTSTPFNLLNFQPPLGAAPTESVVRLLRRRVLRLVPILQQAIVGRLYYVYQPPALTVASDVLEPLIARHVDMVVAYAIALLKRAVDDPSAGTFELTATEMRSEMIQDADPGPSEGLGTDLPGD